MPISSGTWKPGQPRSPKAGRKKGQKNIFFPDFDAAMACREKGVNPFIELATIIDETKSKNTKIAACRILCSYLAPQLKAVEHSSSKESPLTLMFNLGADGRLNGVVQQNNPAIQSDTDSKIISS